MKRETNKENPRRMYFCNAQSYLRFCNTRQKENCQGSQCIITSSNIAWGKKIAIGCSLVRQDAKHPEGACRNGEPCCHPGKPSECAGLGTSPPFSLYSAFLCLLYSSCWLCCSLLGGGCITLSILFCRTLPVLFALCFFFLLLPLVIKPPLSTSYYHYPT